MRSKNQLRTVRFRPEEAKAVDAYIKQNPVFESFSSLARVATLSFISEKIQVHLNPIRSDAKQKRHRFLWDYDLNEVQIREILNATGLSAKKCWLIARILMEARLEEVFDYITLDQIEKALPRLRLPQRVRSFWEEVGKNWSQIKSR